MSGILKKTSLKRVCQKIRIMIARYPFLSLAIISLILIGIAPADNPKSIWWLIGISLGFITLIIGLANMMTIIFERTKSPNVSKFHKERTPL